MNTPYITKDEFVAILIAAGITEAQRTELHRVFEQRHPRQHQAFLEALGIAPDKAAQLRQASVR
jgi:hypothetical protein